uniref:Uncharacterized protein n=1 Tax=Arundo donax TaxID=35708 RepID=A0A0A9F437_ARUDO
MLSGCCKIEQRINIK